MQSKDYTPKAYNMLLICPWMSAVKGNWFLLQGNSQALQQRVEGLEVALRRQDSAVEKLQAGAKRHMEASLRQGTTRKSLQQATQKEDKLRHQLTRTEAELAATRRCPACTLLLMSFVASTRCSVLVFCTLSLLQHMPGEGYQQAL